MPISRIVGYPNPAIRRSKRVLFGRQRYWNVQTRILPSLYHIFDRLHEVALNVVDVQLVSIRSAFGLVLGYDFAQQFHFEIGQLAVSSVGLGVEVEMVASAVVVARQVWVFAVGVVSFAQLADSQLWPGTEARQLVLRQLGHLVAYILGPASLRLVVPALSVPLLLVGYVILALPGIQLARPLTRSSALVHLSFAFLRRAAYHSILAFQVFEMHCPLQYGFGLSQMLGER